MPTPEDVDREQQDFEPAQPATDQARDLGAEERDRDAHARDLAAQARDLAAEERDREAEVRGNGSAARAWAAADRAANATDREAAEQDRDEAAGEREASEASLRHALLDSLTGTYQRGSGLVALQHEIDRARRADGRLVLAFVDVDGLKAVNDRAGHGAGDALLQAVAGAMRSKMRSYEPIVRFGGDEFVCTFGGVDIDSAQARFEEIQGALDQDQNPGTFSFGLAALDPDDSLDDLIGCADDALIEARKSYAQP